MQMTSWPDKMVRAHKKKDPLATPCKTEFVAGLICAAEDGEYI